MTIFNSIILLIVVILANVVGLHAQGRSRLRSPPPPQSPPPPPPAVSFDHFLLVLSWPPVFCNDIYISSNKRRTCISPLPINFTLHGFWPSNKGNSDLKNCDSNGQYPFDANTVAKVGENQLDKDWPSLEEKTEKVPRRIDNIAFWIQQWKSHGTCSVSILDQVQYFSKALKIYNTINVRNMLQKENVIPGRTRGTKGDYVSAIKNQMKVKPQIRCQEIQNRSYLYEIRFCLTASNDPKFIDCTNEYVGCDKVDVYF